MTRGRPLSRPRERALILACLAVLAACSGGPPPPPGNAATVDVVDRGWHTDIGLPADELDYRFDTLRARFPGVRSFTFGFGQRLYVEKRHRTAFDALRALLPSEGLVLVTALNTTPAAAFGARDVYPLAVSSAGFSGIEDFVRRAMSSNAAGVPVFVRDGPYPGSAFYASRLTYDGLFTCNTWTAAALRAGGVPVTVAGVVFAGQVTGQLRGRAVVDAGSPLR